MDSKPTLAELRDRLRQLQAGVDETIKALDSVDDKPRAAPAARPPRANARPEAVTMRDVGRAAGVSQSTVSRVLTPTSTSLPINEATRRRVLAKVKELGYHPNQYARSLRGKKSHMLAIMVADITNPFYHPLVRAIQDVAVQHRYDVMIANTDHTREKEELFFESVLRRPVDGAIVVPYYLNADDFDNLMTRTGVTIAAVGKHVQHPLIDLSFSDDARASHDLVAWLIKARGHRRIAMVCADLPFPVTVGRVDAFRRGPGRGRVDRRHPNTSCPGDWTFETGQRGLRELMALPEPPTAIFAASDTIAIGALEEAEIDAPARTGRPRDRRLRRHPGGAVGTASTDDGRPGPERDGSAPRRGALRADRVGPCPRSPGLRDPLPLHRARVRLTRTRSRSRPLVQAPKVGCREQHGGTGHQRGHHHAPPTEQPRPGGEERHAAPHAGQGRSERGHQALRRRPTHRRPAPGSPARAG